MNSYLSSSKSGLEGELLPSILKPLSLPAYSSLSLFLIMPDLRSISCCNFPMTPVFLLDLNWRSSMILSLWRICFFWDPMMPAFLSISCCNFPMTPVFLSHFCCRLPIVFAFLTSSFFCSPMTPALRLISCSSLPIRPALLSALSF